MKFHTFPWDEKINRSEFLRIINARNKYTNLEFAVEMKESGIDYWFGKDTDLSQIVVRFENDAEEIVGFAGLTNYSGAVDTYRVVHAILPKYFHTELPRVLINAAIELGKKNGLSKLMLAIFGSRCAPFEEVMRNKGIKIAFQVYDLVLSNLEIQFAPSIKEDVVFQTNDEFEDYTEYVRILNDAFRNSFEFSESTVEPVTKRINQIKTHGLDFNHCAAYVNEKMIGVCDFYLYPTEFKGVIENLSVLPDFQHRGFGSGLFAYCITVLKAKGCNIIKMPVRVEKMEELSFFKKFGFETDEKEIQTYYQVI